LSRVRAAIGARSVVFSLSIAALVSTAARD
jgi:hypothetical protein